MNCIVYLVVILAVVANLSSAANLTVANATEEYVSVWNRQYQSYIKDAEMKIQCVDARGADSIRVMKDQQEVILKEIKRYEDSLIPVESLSLIQKHCVQKYKTMLVSYESALASFKSCITVAQLRVNSLTGAAKNSVADAKTSVNVNLPNKLSSCTKVNKTANEECILSNVDYYTNNIQTLMRSVDKNLDASLCISVDLSRDAIQCSFAIERDVLVNIGKVQALIDICVKETETVCPCANKLMVENTTPNVSSLLTRTIAAKPST